jgi:hypothetical protein
LIPDRASSALLLAVSLAALAVPATILSGEAPPRPTEAQHSQQDSDDGANDDF